MSDEQPSVDPYMDETDPYDYNYQPFQRQAEESVKETEQIEEPSQPQKKLPPPPIVNYNRTSVDDEDDSEKEMKEEELKRKALELAKREAELERRERELQQKVEQIPPYKKPNFPICYPIVYHNISDEIEAGVRRKIAYMGYIGWFILIGLVVLNFLCACATIAAPVSTGGIIDPTAKAKFIIISLLWIIIGIPGHFIVCYWPLYTTMRSCHAGRFFLFFIGYAIAIIMSGFAISGLYEYGPCGIIAAIAYLGAVGEAPWVFIMQLAMAGLWGLQLAYYVIIYIMVISVFRKRHSLSKVAKQVKDEVVQQAAKTVVQSAINSINASDNSV